MPTLSEAAGALDSNWSDRDLIALATRFKEEADDPLSVARLAESLAASGAIESFDHSADVASTGGPSSLTTLMCPLYLVLAGWDVPKIAVPGRPAGGIDVLGTLAGYETRPTVEQMRSWICHSHYVHAEAADAWAPLDGRLFRLRQQHALQNITPLVVASILSKKRALRITKAVVEIRRGPFANIQDDDKELERAQRLFREAAALMDFSCEAIITGDGGPYQGFIGRGEALSALHDFFEGVASDDVEQHAVLCRALAERAVGTTLDFDRSRLKNAFAENLSIQGSSYELFSLRVIELRAQKRTPIVSTFSGNLAWDLAQLRNAIVEFQGRTSSRFSDDAGVQLLLLGGAVEKGQLIALARGEPRFVEAVAGCQFELRT